MPVAPEQFEVLTMEEAAESIRALVGTDMVQSAASTGKWSAICNAFADCWTRTTTLEAHNGTDAAKIAVHKAFISEFLDKAISPDRKDVVRKRAQKQFSANLRILRALDVGRESPLYCWPPKIEKPENVAKAAIEEWIKNAGEPELVACAALLPALTESVLAARESALLSLTPDQRRALGL